MSLDIAMVTFDCSDPDALAAWWHDAVGGDVNAVAPGEFVMVARADGPTLGFQKVPDPTPGKINLYVGKTAAIAPIAARHKESILWSPIGGVCYGTSS